MSNIATSDAKPKWFISRGPGVFTALIPADELPHSVHLKGVSRLLTTDQMVGMSFVADVGPTKQRFLLELSLPLAGLGAGISPKIPEVVRPTSVVPYPIKSEELPVAASMSENVSSEHKTMPTTIAPTSRFFPPTVADPSPAAAAPAAATAAAVVSPQSYEPLPPSGILPDERKKVYCTHWMAHNTCHFSQTGCKYKHEFPEDLATLKQLGFSDWPKWYVEKQGRLRSSARGMRARNETPRSTQGPVQNKGQQLSFLGAAKRVSTSPAGVNPSSRRKPAAAVGMTNVAPRKASAGPAPLDPPRALMAKGSARALSAHGLDGAGQVKKLEQVFSDLIDLSDEGNRFHTSTAAANSSASPSISPASTDSEDVAEPLTPEPIAVMMPKGKGVSIPAGNASPSRHRSQQVHHKGKTGGRKGRGGAAGRPGRGFGAAAAAAKQKAGGGLHASRHADGSA